MIAGQIMLVRWPDALLVLHKGTGFQRETILEEIRHLQDYVYLKCNRIGNWWLWPIAAWEKTEDELEAERWVEQFMVRFQKGVSVCQRKSRTTRKS